MDITRDIDTLEHFQEHPEEFLLHLRQTGDPIILTIEGRAEIVVLSAGKYQRMQDIVSRWEAAHALEETAKGTILTTREALEEQRQKYGF